MIVRSLPGLALIALSIGLGFITPLLEGFDRSVFGLLAMTGAQTPGLAIDLAQRITLIGNFGPQLIILAIGTAAFLLARQPRQAIILVLGTLAAAAATSVVKGAFGRLRPDLVPHLTDFANPSFPSGHASNTMAMLMLMALLTRRRVPIAAALVIALAVGWTRVALGVHWPTDVIGGWTLGAGFALVAAPFVGRGGTSEEQGLR